MADHPKTPADEKLVPPEPPRSFAAGEEDGYQTDTFSRNDQEGRIVFEDEPEPTQSPGGTSDVEAPPEAAHRKATDDADSRDAEPPTAQGGGVR
ncbi:MAG TPA: hypothetical protein VMU93_03940 [Caulobacteraceae bacterium]|nr:hypothetical protein [Caulobacteraceae bacterium]